MTTARFLLCLWPAPLKGGDIGPGHLQGQFLKGEKYTIVVDVKHDAKGVSIGYKESTGLNYGSNGTIHKTYNERVKDLEKAMRAELGAF